MKDRDALIERASGGEPVSARVAWKEKKKKRGKAPLRARPSPPLDERTAPEPPPENAIIEAWKGASAFDRRTFVRAARTELTAILKNIDVERRVPAPVVSLHG